MQGKAHEAGESVQEMADKGRVKSAEMAESAKDKGHHAAEATQEQVCGLSQSRARMLHMWSTIPLCFVFVQTKGMLDKAKETIETIKHKAMEGVEVSGVSDRQPR
jgi:hypothetical protein